MTDKNDFIRWYCDRTCLPQDLAEAEFFAPCQDRDEAKRQLARRKAMMDYWQMCLRQKGVEQELARKEMHDVDVRFDMENLQRECDAQRTVNEELQAENEALQAEKACIALQLNDALTALEAVRNVPTTKDQVVSMVRMARRAIASKTADLRQKVQENDFTVTLNVLYDSLTVTNINDVRVQMLDMRRKLKSEENIRKLDAMLDKVDKWRENQGIRLQQVFNQPVAQAIGSVGTITNNPTKDD